MKLGGVLLGALIVAAVVACSSGGSSGGGAPYGTCSPTATPEFSPALIGRIASEMPGFSGISDDPATNTLEVRMTHDVTDVEALKSAIVAEFPQFRDRQIKLIDNAERLGHLQEWQSQLQRAVPNWVMAGLTPSGDRVGLGVVSGEACDDAYRIATELGIPREAVYFEVTGPIGFSD